MISASARRCASFIIRNSKEFSPIRPACTIDSLLTTKYSSAHLCRTIMGRNFATAPESKDSKEQSDSKEVEVTFNSDGESYKVKGEIGHTLLDVVFNKEVPLDGYGACEGTLACSTCHVILKQKDFDKLEAPCDEELDMLDLAYGLTDTSRLGCQIELTKDMDGLEVEVPAGVADARLS